MTDSVSLREHFQALRKADRRFDQERDRRYAEVALARAEALRIKEAGDAKALVLAAEIQSYRDEQDNKLREQINSERGLYSTKEEMRASEDKFAALIKPLADYVTAQMGQAKGIGQSWGVLLGVASASVVAVEVFRALSGA